MKCKQWIKKWLIPPGIKEIIMSWRSGNLCQARFMCEYRGGYSDWESAQRASKGYDAHVIFQRTLEAERLVRDGHVPFQRDGHVFTEGIQYTWPLLANLLFVMARENGKVNFVDFGGSLGCIYRQNIKYLREFDSFRWSVVEQPHFVTAGKEEFENEQLKFYYSVDECLQVDLPNVLLLGGVIEYIENPYTFLESMLKHEFKYIILDRTTFSRNDIDDISVQMLPDYLYDASYPCYMLSRSRLFELMKKEYTLIEEYDIETQRDDATQPLIYGFLWQRIS